MVGAFSRGCLATASCSPSDLQVLHRSGPMAWVLPQFFGGPSPKSYSAVGEGSFFSSKHTHRHTKRQTLLATKWPYPLSRSMLRRNCLPSLLNLEGQKMHFSEEFRMQPAWMQMLTSGHLGLVGLQMGVGQFAQSPFTLYLKRELACQFRNLPETIPPNQTCFLCTPNKTWFATGSPASSNLFYGSKSSPEIAASVSWPILSLSGRPSPTFAERQSKPTYRRSNPSTARRAWRVAAQWPGGFHLGRRGFVHGHLVKAPGKNIFPVVMHSF